VLELFLNEGKILRKLHHKNIVEVSDLFEFEGSHYIVMEYIHGRTLHDIIKRETGPIRRERAINLFKQMLEGVAYIHNQPETIIHRDIKPLNILVTEDDTVKITDFGIAKALDAGGHASTVVKGTPVYMSPEQIINPKTVDIRTDVYSLGMTFYEMLCAKTPFSGDTTTTPTAVYAAIMNGEVPPPTQFYPGITDALSDFVMKSIHKDRSQRFADANEMLRELEKLENSGATTFQELPKYVPPVVKKPEPKEPIASTVVPTRIGKPEYKPEESNSSAVTPKEIKINKNNIWKWVVGFVLVLAVILVITIPKKKKEAPPTDSPTVESVSTLTPDQQKEMISVEGGTFEMGSGDGQSDEKPVHEVTVESFMIGKYEVSQQLWESVMGSKPSNFKGNGRPVETVSWYDVVEFCNKLSENEGLQKAYSGSGANVTCDFNSNGYRLPTEAEWEYAARGGKKSKGYTYSGSNDIDAVSWYTNNSGSTSHDVGTKQPNELGIFDMSGNVWEWCWDWYGDYTSTSQTNPKGANAGSFRVNRGGSWSFSAGYCRVAGRGGNYPEYRFDDLGFRLVRTK
jgi:sulfatase modifying factor 1